MSREIRFIDFSREYEAIREEIDSAITKTLTDGVYILGPQVEAFEQELATYIGAPYAVGVASGTDALYLSLLASGIGKGDEVIVPVNTAVPTATAVVMCGARPVFVDCDDSYLMDISRVPSSITQKTKAIIPVHLYGRACDMDALTGLAKKHSLTLIEDCAQACGAKWKGRRVGSFGDFGAFSFYPTKNLGAYGDGGAITVRTKEHDAKLRSLRFYGKADGGLCTTFGINSRLDELHASMLRVKLRHLDDWNGKRETLANLYRKLIHSSEITVPTLTEKWTHSYHLFVVRSANRDETQKRLAKAGIGTLIHYPIPLHTQPFFAPFARGEFPNAERFSREIVSLPLYPFLKEEEIRYIAETLGSVS